MPFVCLIAVMIGGSIYLVVSRREMLRSEHRLDSLLSRESVFIANNLVLVGLCFVIFWGTYFPLISEALTGQEASVGPPWFDRYTVPLALILVLLSGIGPVIAWRRATLANARRNFLVPSACALLDAARAAPAGVAQKPLASAMFCCAAFVFGSIGQEFFRGARARRAMAGEPVPLALLALVQAQPPPLRRLHRPRRHRRAVRRRRRLLVLPARVRAGLSPGQSTRVGAYTIRTCADASVTPTTTRAPENAKNAITPRAD